MLIESPPPYADFAKNGREAVFLFALTYQEKHRAIGKRLAYHFVAVHESVVGPFRRLP
jgi:hypothetical protein